MQIKMDGKVSEGTQKGDSMCNEAKDWKRILEGCKI